MEKEIVNYPNIHGVAFTGSETPESFPAHWHDAAEFTVILKEGCRYKVGDRSLSPRPGDILLVWPRQLHSIVHVPMGGAAFIQFSASLIESNADLTAAAGFLHDCQLIPAESEPELAGRIRELVYGIRDGQDDRQMFAETRCKMLVYEILVLVGEHVMRERREQIGSGRFSDRAWGYIRAACGYIAEHSSEEITQAEVAERTGVSPYYFSKIFNEYTRTSFPNYLASIRVQNAIHLLADGSRSITDCAYAAGFQSTTSFNKLFHEMTGCSPREYRKLHRHGNPSPSAPAG